MLGEAEVVLQNQGQSRRDICENQQEKAEAPPRMEIVRCLAWQKTPRAMHGTLEHFIGRDCLHYRCVPCVRRVTLLVQPGRLHIVEFTGCEQERHNKMLHQTGTCTARSGATCTATHMGAIFFAPFSHSICIRAK